MQRFWHNLLMELGPLYHHAAIMLILFYIAWFGWHWPQLYLGWLSIFDFSVGIKYYALFWFSKYQRSSVGQPSHPSGTSHPAQIRMNPLLLALQAILILSAVHNSWANHPDAPYTVYLFVQEGDTATFLCDVPIDANPTSIGAIKKHKEYTTGEHIICIRISIFQYYWSPTLQLELECHK